MFGSESSFLLPTRAAIFAGFIALATSAHAAMLIDNYATETNDRFQNSDDPDQFFLSSFDLSGVGKDSNGRWATLIGTNTIISANHFKPSGTITFFADNDANSTPIQIELSGDSQRIGNSDLWLARLEDFAPSNLTIYDIATEEITDNGDPFVPTDFSFQDEEAFMVGLSPSSFPNTQDQAFGTNLMNDFFTGNVSGLGDVEALEMRYDTDPSETEFESFFRSGDSGGPLLFDNGNDELLLLGINSFVTTDNGDPVASFSSYVGNDSSEINAIVTQYAAIPEPSIALLIIVALICLFLFRSRNRTHSA